MSNVVDLHKHCKASNMMAAEFRRVVWDYLVPEGTPMKALLDPAYWANVVHKGIQSSSLIQCRWDDGSRWAELLVLEAGRTHLRVQVLRDIELAKLGTPVEVEVEGFVVRHRGFGKWAVFQEDGTTLVKSGFDSRAHAEDFCNKPERVKKSAMPGQV